MRKTKSFDISIESVEDAHRKVKKKKGGPGVDGVTLQEFQLNLEDNLYKIWNRMSSGSYFPSPVLRVEIPKDDGSSRKLGVPTVTDRVAQMVARNVFEPILEPIFHPDSYGYRPGKSALDAVKQVRQRCWKNDWVLDLDIKGFFDNLDHDIMMELLERHTDSKWVLLYTKRWLTAPVQIEEGVLEERNKGTPQGGVISPILANLYLHHAFDEWMRENVPTVPFVRYADDIIVHCRSEKQANWLREEITKQLAKYKLQLHPKKTKVVYCKDDERKGKYPETKFDFLGFEFRRRTCKNRKTGKLFTGFNPAISPKSLRNINKEIRDLRIHSKTGNTLEQIAKILNPMVSGWVNYYGRFHGSKLGKVWWNLNWILYRWYRNRYKKHSKSKRRSWAWLNRIIKKEPTLFKHWEVMYQY